MSRPARLRGTSPRRANQRDETVKLVGEHAGLQLEVEVVLPGAGEDVERLVVDVVGQDVYSDLLLDVVLRSIICKVLPR